MAYRVVLIEDEKHQQETMVSLLSEHPEFQVTGMASNMEMGKELLKNLKPDLALLDVMLGAQTSFEMLKALDPIEFEIIFTTSYDHFAVHAFRLSAIDYLLKPIDKTELAAALEKFKERKQGQAVAPNIKNMLANLELPPTDGKAKVALPTLNGFLFVAIQDIVWCKADSAYSTFGMSNGEEVIVSKTLKEAELMLIEYGFFRIHNSHLINQHHILEYIRGDGGQVRMTGGALLEVSRRRKEEFLNRLNVK